MRIGLYGMPASGKTYILDRIGFMETVSGSRLLHKCDPLFGERGHAEKERVRKNLAVAIAAKDNLIMDGHYSFGNETAFTEEDGQLYDVFMYLYISPAVLKARMSTSEKNQKYLAFDVERWQKSEIENLRDYCHRNMKDFYVIDNPPANTFDGIGDIINFIHAVKNGYSCAAFARRCVADILTQSPGKTVTLLDGDKTLTVEDTSAAVLGYKTQLYNGNFYTGYQAWKQAAEFNLLRCPDILSMPADLNEKVLSRLNGPAYILTSGHEKIWGYISGQLNFPCYSGIEMTAETKLYITKGLQAAGKYVIAYGDSMNDYFMLRQADEGHLVAKPDGTVSKSLEEKDLEGLGIV